MTQFLKLYAISITVFFAIDMLWLGVIARGFYRQQIGHLLKPEVNWAAAFVFYFIFLIGVVLFVVQPALEKQSLMHSVIFGAIFGLVTYSAYDLTNLAVTKDWPLTITIVDMTWGTVLCMLVSVITFSIAQKVL